MTDFRPGAYEVENEVFSGKFAQHLECSDGLVLSDQQALTDRLTEALGVASIRCVRMQHRSRPSYSSHASRTERLITFGALAGPAVVCHEVAHILAGQERDAEVAADGYSHGPTWQAEYVRCVEVLLGAYHARRLATAFGKFEADKTRNKAKAAVKRGKQRSAQKSGPEIRPVVTVNEFTGKLRSKALGKATITWAKPYNFLAIRYQKRGKGWYWMVSAYLRSDLPERGTYSAWEALARGESDRCLWTEQGFQTKSQALEWALLWAKERGAS